MKPTTQTLTTERRDVSNSQVFTIAVQSTAHEAMHFCSNLPLEQWNKFHQWSAWNAAVRKSETLFEFKNAYIYAF